jgi:hypothetical protein
MHTLLSLKRARSRGRRLLTAGAAAVLVSLISAAPAQAQSNAAQVGERNASVKVTVAIGSAESAADNGGCSKWIDVLDSRVQACISRPRPGVVVADAYVATPGDCSCRKFRLLLMQDLPAAIDRPWKVNNFPYRTSHLSLGEVNVSVGRYYADIWVMQNDVRQGGIESPRQRVF